MPVLSIQCGISERIAAPDQTGKRGVFMTLHSPCPFVGLHPGSTQASWEEGPSIKTGGEEDILVQSAELLVGYFDQGDKGFVRDASELLGNASSVTFSCRRCGFTVPLSQTMAQGFVTAAEAYFNRAKERRRRGNASLN